MARPFRFEVTEAGPVKPSIQVDLGDRHRPPLAGLCEDLTIVPKHCRNHPITGRFGMGAANEVDVILASSSSP